MKKTKKITFKTKIVNKLYIEKATVTHKNLFMLRKSVFSEF